MKFNLANLFSLLRVALAPLFIFLLLGDDPADTIAAVIVFIIAALTDYLDGWFARRFEQVSSWGVFFDPLADKVLTTAAFIAFVVIDLIPGWMVVVVVVRDVFITAMRVYADTVGAPVVTSQTAKVKTFLQMLFIGYALAMLLIAELATTPELYAFAMAGLEHNVLLYSMLGITLFTAWTGVEYGIANRRLFTQLLQTNVGKDRTLGELLQIGFVSVFGAGFFPFASGTFGSAVAIGLLLLPTDHIHLVLLVASVICFFIGSAVVNNIERLYGKDPSVVVIDEAVGMWLVLASPYVPHTPLWICIGFFLFRVFDVLKPYPIGKIDEREGGLFVMLDDVLAAIYASIFYHFAFATYTAMPLIKRFLGM